MHETTSSAICGITAPAALMRLRNLVAARRVPSVSSPTVPAVPSSDPLSLPAFDGEVRVGAEPRAVRIYLAGSVPKGKEDGRDPGTFWSEEDERLIREGVDALTVETLNPNKSGVPRGDFYANFGCDLHLVDSSDVVFVDGRARRGIGVGAEMMFAQVRGRRVVAICPSDSAYRRRDVQGLFGEDLEEWIHPFIFGLADHIAASVEEAIGWVNGWLEAGRPAKAPADLHQAIEYYRELAAGKLSADAPHAPTQLRRAWS